MIAIRLVDGSLLAQATATVLVPVVRGTYAWLLRTGIAHPVR